MNRSKTVWPILIVVALLAGAVGGYLLAGSSDETTATSQSPGASTHEPVVPVHLAELKKRKLDETLVAYGTVVTAPGESVTVSVNYEARVKRLRVAAGQSVEAGTPLVELHPSSDTQLRIAEARDALNSAEADLALAKQRVGLGLATQSDVLQAQQRVTSAQSRVQNLSRRGSGGQVIRAKQAGIVSRIDVETGSIVTAGAPLLEMVGEGEIAVRLGVEAEDVAHIHASMPVTLEPVNLDLPSPIDGKVYLISREVDPQTRLVDVFVAPANTDRLLLHQYMRGKIAISSNEALVAPRAAVLPTEGGYRVFTVVDGRAKARDVQIGVENDGFVEITSGELRPGDQVVTTGNSELSDGMAVSEEKP